VDFILVVILLSLGDEAKKKIIRMINAIFNLIFLNFINGSNAKKLWIRNVAFIDKILAFLVTIKRICKR